MAAPAPSGIGSRVRCGFPLSRAARYELPSLGSGVRPQLLRRLGAALGLLALGVEHEYDQIAAAARKVIS